MEGATGNQSSRTVPVPTVALEPSREQIGKAIGRQIGVAADQLDQVADDRRIAVGFDPR